MRNNIPDATPHVGLGALIHVALVLSSLVCSSACLNDAVDRCAGWTEGGGACASLADCAFSGDCIDGACRCDAPYSGPHCESLDLGTSRVALDSEDASYWDGSAVRARDGRYVLFASRFSRGCGLDAWRQNSECIRAYADSPAGPYTDVEVVAGTFCHNATIRERAGGGVLLYAIGEPKPESAEVIACSSGTTVGTVDGGLDITTCIIQVFAADDPTGAFEQRVPISFVLSQPALCPTNPAPVLESDGSITMIFRAYASIDPVSQTAEEALYVTRMSTWDERLEQPSAKLFDDPAEDPFVYRDPRRGTYHLLYNAKFTNPDAVGGHAVSPDGIHWTVLPPIYDRRLRLSDGTTTVVARRERPSVYFEDACHGVLFTSVQADDASDATHVVATTIGASVPSYE